MVLDLLEAIAGAALVLALPGLAWCRAIFPEWRWVGPMAITHALRTAAVAFTLSLATTIVVGTGLLGLAIAPYPASWADPVLEGILAAITLVGVVVAYLRGGLAREPLPTLEAPAAPGDATLGAWLAEAARLRSEGRRLRHRLRAREVRDADREELRRRLEENEAAVAALERRRGEELDA